MVRDLQAEGSATVDVLSTPDKWYGVTYHEDKAGVVAAMTEKTAEGVYPAPLWK